MLRETQAALFIRVLAEEFEFFRALRKFGFSRQIKGQAKRLRQHGETHRLKSAGAPEPLDCLQMMSTAPQRRNG